MKPSVIMKSIDEERIDAERRLGRPISIYRAFPRIGRGFVRHDTISHDEIERLYQRAERGVCGYFIHRLKRRFLKRGCA